MVYRVSNFHLTMSTIERGLSSKHYSPLAPELPSLGVKPLLFSKSCGVFCLMWSVDIVWCVRENVEGKVECLCMWVCAHSAVRVTWLGHISQRAAGPDIWLPLTVHSRRGWSVAGPTPASSVPQDKSRGPVERCEFSGFCAQSPETCRVRNLTFAESQIVF